MSVNTNDQGVITEMIVLHSDYYKVNAVERILDMTCPVDSGQAGIFDADLYAQHQGGEYDQADTFYGQVCHLTCDTEQSGGVVTINDDTFGAVSTSGYGDGDYRMEGWFYENQLVGIRIYFDNEDDEDDDEDASEEDAYYCYW